MYGANSGISTCGRYVHVPSMFPYYVPLMTCVILKPCLGTSHFLLRHLNRLLNHRKLYQIPPHSLLAYWIHLVTAFAISTFFHVLSLSGLARGYTPIRGIITNMVLFFMVQPFAAVFESAVSAGYGRFVVGSLLRLAGGEMHSDGKGVDTKGDAQVQACADGKSARVGSESVNTTPLTSTAATATSTATPGTDDKANLIPQTDNQRHQRRRHALLFWSAVFGRAVGYIWVAFWFFLTGRWFLRPYIDVGVTSWGVPFSFAEWLLFPDGCH